MIDILLDVDGVLADFTGGTLDTLQRLGGPAMSHDDVTAWDISSLISLEFRERTIAYWRAEGWCEGLMPYPHAQAAATILGTIGKVHFLTAHLPGSDYWLGERMRWLRMHFQARDVDVTFTHHKHRYHGHLFVDDKLEHVIKWALVHPGDQAVLWAQPYSLDCGQLPSNAIRTGDWSVVFDLARRIARREAGVTRGDS